MKHIKKTKTKHKIALLKGGKIVSFAFSIFSAVAGPAISMVTAYQLTKNKGVLLIAPLIPLIVGTVSAIAGYALYGKEKMLEIKDEPELEIQHNESEFVDYEKIGYCTDRNPVLGGYTDNGFVDYTDINGNPIFTENDLPDVDSLTK